MNLQYPLDDTRISYKRVQIIKQRSGKVILVGRNSAMTDYSVIIIKRAKDTETDWNLRQLLTQIHGSLQQEEAELEVERNVRKRSECQIINCFGILGFAKFLQGYYLLYIEEKERVANIGRHKIYLIKKVGIIPLFDQARDETRSNQKEYYSKLQDYALENCYYSHTYDLTNSLAKNMTRNSVQLFESDKQHTQPPSEEGFYTEDRLLNGYCEVFQWNYHLQKEFHQVIDRKKWLIPMIHGYCKEINLKTKGTRFNVIIISRRSRHHAGTRYIKRGMNQHGFVANFVQTQQIVLNDTSSQDTKPICSSFIQVRGSAPVYWMQQPSMFVAKPPIQLVQSDPLFVSTRKHFRDMIARYGRKIFCINLMKAQENTPRETILCDHYAQAMEFINKYDLESEDLIHYIHIDYKSMQKQDKAGLVDKIHFLAYYFIMKTGLFVCINSSRTDYSQYVQFQNGVIRGNCVDCLDRTNSFQQLVGELALEIQIAILLRQNVSYKNCKRNYRPFKEYGALYEQMGDLISIQYGSSLAHKQKVNKTEGKRFEILTSLKRHLNNNLKDNDRQQEIDIFLGEFQTDGPPIWKLKPPITFFPHKNLRRFEQGNWLDEAYQYFEQQNMIGMFRRLNEDDKLELSKLSRVAGDEFDRQEFLVKFDVAVVDNLFSTKRAPILLQFCVTPKLRLEKRVWRQMNPKSHIIKPLQKQMKKQYYNLNAEEQRFRPSDELEKRNKNDVDDLLKEIKMNQGPRQCQLAKFISQQVKRYMQMRDELDEEELSVIQNYVNNRMVSQDVITDDLENQSDLMLDDNEVNVDYELTQNEWKNVEDQIRTGDYLHIKYPDEPASHMNMRRKEKKKMQIIKSPVKRKIEKFEEHKTQILEEIIKKYFSHGQKVGKISLI